QIELLALTRLLFRSVVGIGDEGFSPLVFREQFEKVDDIIQLGRVHQLSQFTSPLTSCHSGERANQISEYAQLSPNQLAGSRCFSARMKSRFGIIIASN